MLRVQGSGVEFHRKGTKNVVIRDNSFINNGSGVSSDTNEPYYDIAIINNYIFNCSYGLRLNGEHHRLLIDGNEFINTELKNIWHFIKFNK